MFAPGVRDADTIGTLVKAINAPLNILLQPGGATLPELQRLGVARASIGSGAARVALGAAKRMCQGLLAHGDHTKLLEGAVSWDEVNRLLGRG